jgi:hypothetical protein
MLEKIRELSNDKMGKKLKLLKEVLSLDIWRIVY